MVNFLQAACLLLTLCNVGAQFYDFFSALQPNQPTLRPIFQFDVTTKRPRTQTKSRHESTRRHTESTTKSFYFAELETGQKTKAVRKPNEDNSRRNYDTNTNSREKSRDKVVYNNNGRNNESDKKNTGSNNRYINKQSDDDRLIFDDGKRNTVVNYKTTKSYAYNTKKDRTTQRTPTRPGVIAAVANGPPITNRPSTRRPAFGRPVTDDDTSVSPELIIGPDEDYMTVVEKKRHIEIAEKMCDKYKALDIQQVEAIPLLPSPESVKVNVSVCNPNEVALILGGAPANIQEFRHMALLGWNKLPYGGYSWKCGGSLVSDQFVLTAAHCAYQDRDSTVAIGAPRVVQLGTSIMDDPGAIIRKVASVIRHPKYKLPKSYYDIAIVKMASTVKFSSVIKPACMGIPPPPGSHIIATGWGKTEYSDHSPVLLKVSLPIWDITECYSALGTSRKLPEGPTSDSQVCAGVKPGGKDTCQGDSGGPAQIQEGCSWRVVAVTSLGRSCGAAQTPGVYAIVQRAFVSAVVFKDQYEKEKQTNNQWNTQQLNTQQSNNQQRNPQYWNRNQEESTRNPQSTQYNGQNSRNPNNDRRNTQSNVYEDSRNKYNDNQRGSSNENNNRYTTSRPGYNNAGNGNGNGYSVASSGYQSDGGYYSDRQWWT